MHEIKDLRILHKSREICYLSQGCKERMMSFSPCSPGLGGHAACSWHFIWAEVFPCMVWVLHLSFLWSMICPGLKWALSFDKTRPESQTLNFMILLLFFHPFKNTSNKWMWVCAVTLITSSSSLLQSSCASPHIFTLSLSLPFCHSPPPSLSLSPSLLSPMSLCLCCAPRSY